MRGSPIDRICSTVSSVEPSSTTIISIFSYVCRKAELTLCRIHFAPLNVGKQIETNGSLSLYIYPDQLPETANLLNTHKMERQPAQTKNRITARTTFRDRLSRSAPRICASAADTFLSPSIRRALFTASIEKRSAAIAETRSAISFGR